MIMSNSKDDWGNSYFPNTNDVSVAGTGKYSMISFKTFSFAIYWKLPAVYHILK